MKTEASGKTGKTETAHSSGSLLEVERIGLVRK